MFDEAFREEFERLLRSRRDVRHFRQDTVEPAVIDRLLHNAMLAPSVGFSQPWRWVVVNNPEIRLAIAAEHERAKADAGRIYRGAEAVKYAALKLAGLREAPVHLAVFADPGAETGHGLGRQTMPETVVWSVMMAVYALWLSAAAEGLGMGWVSIVDPVAVTALLDVPPQWVLVAYVCLGWPEAYLEQPLLETAGWESRLAWGQMVLER